MGKKFTQDNYIQVTGYAITGLGLKGNELLCWSLIYGFTQDGESDFHGSLSYISSALNITIANAKAVIDRLISKGLLAKKVVYENKVRYCHYVAIKPEGVLLKQERGIIETITPPIIETITNNKDVDITKHNEDLFNTNIAEKSKGTTEKRCLFADSRYYDIEKFCQQFKGDEYYGIDIAYYWGVVADWSAANNKKKNDWIATARNFIRGDMQKGTVRKLQSGMSADAMDYIRSMQ